MSETTTFRDRVAEYFKARPYCWIDGVTLEGVGGRYAWRSRVSDCRLQLGMDIRNRQRRQTDATGRRWTLSEYQYVPPASVTVDDGGQLAWTFQESA